MEAAELNRLEQGKKIMGKIAKLKAQIESLADVSSIQLKSVKKQKSHSVIPYGGFYGSPIEVDTDVQYVNHDIPLNIKDKVPHPFANESVAFVGRLKQFLMDQVAELENKFNEL